MQATRVGAFTRSRQVLFAEPAAAARNHEGIDDSLPRFEIFHFRTHLLDYATELVAKDVTLLKL